MGGSHGGFLTGHLVGQHSARFCTGILRNPVPCPHAGLAQGLDHSITLQ